MADNRFIKFKVDLCREYLQEKFNLDPVKEWIAFNPKDPKTFPPTGSSDNCMYYVLTDDRSGWGEYIYFAIFCNDIRRGFYTADGYNIEDAIAYMLIDIPNYPSREDINGIDKIDNKDLD